MSIYYQDESVTLHHGDCREVLATMGDKSVDVVITDPPYAAETHEFTRTNNTAYGRRGNRVLSGIKTFSSITEEDLRTNLEELGRITSGWVIANMDYRHAFTFAATELEALRLLRIGVWVKTNPNPQISGDRPAQGWEAIAYMHRRDIRPSWSGGGRAGNFVLPSSQGQGHPTSKPLGMVRQWLEWFTKPGDVVFDGYAGSGTTGRAAVDAGCKAILCEADEGFCELIVKRLSQGVLNFGEGA